MDVESGQKRASRSTIANSYSDIGSRWTLLPRSERRRRHWVSRGCQQECCCCDEMHDRRWVSDVRQGIQMSEKKEKNGIACVTPRDPKKPSGSSAMTNEEKDLPNTQCCCKRLHDSRCFADSIRESLQLFRGGWCVLLIISAFLRKHGPLCRQIYSPPSRWPLSPI